MTRTKKPNQENINPIKKENKPSYKNKNTKLQKMKNQNPKLPKHSLKNKNPKQRNQTTKPKTKKRTTKPRNQKQRTKLQTTKPKDQKPKNKSQNQIPNSNGRECDFLQDPLSKSKPKIKLWATSYRNPLESPSQRLSLG